MNVWRTAAISHSLLLLEESVHIVPAYDLMVLSFTLAVIVLTKAITLSNVSTE